MNARKLGSERPKVAREAVRLDWERTNRGRGGRPCLEAATAGERGVLEMIADRASLAAILDALCLAVEETCRGSFCSILLLDEKGERLWQGAAPSLPKSYLEALSGHDIASCWGPCGAAAFHKEQVIAADIKADAHWKGCRDMVLAHGLRACWSTPILSSEGRVLGTLAILSREPCRPTPDHQGIVRQFTRLARVAIERERTEEALRRSAQLARGQTDALSRTLKQALAHQAMLALQLMRLSQQSRQAAVMAERNRMARDIHDTLAQGFTGVILQLEAVEEAMFQGLTAKAGECVARARALARESLQEARRSVRALRLPSLEVANLSEALQNLIQKMTAGTRLRAEFNVRGRQPELPPEWEENLLRIGQEVLTNALRHAQASEFKARLIFDEEAVRLELCDNGNGFEPSGRHDGFGLQGMKERAQAMGGRLTIQSATNEGTAVSIVLPLAPDTLETLAA